MDASPWLGGGISGFARWFFPLQFVVSGTVAPSDLVGLKVFYPGFSRPFRELVGGPALSIRLGSLDLRRPD